MGWDGKGKVGNDTVKKMVIFICVLEFLFYVAMKGKKDTQITNIPSKHNLLFT